MKGRLLLLFTISLAFLFASVNHATAQTKRKAMRDMEGYRYEIECVGVGTPGTFLVKVWNYSKTPKIAIEQAKKNAVHGVIFKGFGGRGVGCTSQKPLAEVNVEDLKSDFFNTFFADGGKYLDYVAIQNDGSIDSDDRIKVGKEYKLGIVVSIKRDALITYLKTAKIIN